MHNHSAKHANKWLSWPIRSLCGSATIEGSGSRNRSVELSRLRQCGFPEPEFKKWPLCAVCAGSQLSDAQLTAEIGTFLMGGFETTAHTLSFTVFCIANNLNIQDRIAAELTSLGLLSGKSEARGLQYEDLPKLSYLDSVLKESMRMFPVVAGFPRC